jgi:alkanesulfonate monooxygenase SsuD/methylene tetrahydromethanopterin reductase-like flavin-dependent oxidoreductase (luciferase family)
MDFALQTGGDYPSVLSAARWAEDEGLVAVGLADHYVTGVGGNGEIGPAFDPYPQLAGLARETTSIELAVYVSPITFRHPAVLLKNAVTVDHMSGGRFHLGVGTGWLEREHEIFGIAYPGRAERYAMLEDALGYLRAGLSADAVGHDGPYFRLEPVAVAPRPLGPMRLIVGGVGDVKTPRLAGAFADEYNVYPGTAEQLSARVGRWRRAAEEAGRDPSALLLSSAGAVLAAPTESGYRERLSAAARAAGVDTEELEAHFAYRSTPRGSFERVADTLGRLADTGVERFYLQRGADFDREEDLGLLEYLRRAIG